MKFLSGLIIKKLSKVANDLEVKISANKVNKIIKRHINVVNEHFKEDKWNLNFEGMKEDVLVDIFGVELLDAIYVNLAHNCNCVLEGRMLVDIDKYGVYYSPEKDQMTISLTGDDIPEGYELIGDMR